jgi:hypothetical protein
MIDPRKALEEELALTDEQRKGVAAAIEAPVQANNQQQQQIKNEKQQQVADAPKEAAAANKRQDDMLQSKQQSNGVAKVASELGTAVVGAGIDAAEGIGATAERVLTGKVNDKNFTPTWLQVDDKVEPMNKTWWGNAIRSIGEYAVLGLVTRKVGGKLPGGAGKLLASEGIKNELVRGAIVGNLSSSAEGKNFSNIIHETFPFVPTPLAVTDADSPMMKRVKSTLEGAGFDAVFGAVGATANALKAKKAAQGAIDNEALRKTLVPRVESLAQGQARKAGIDAAKVEYEGLRNQWVAENNGATVTSSKIQAEVNALKSQAKKAGGVVDEAQLKVLQERQARAAAVEKAGQRLAKLKADDAIARKPPTPDEVAAKTYESSLKKHTQLSEKVDSENAVHFYQKDPEFQNGPNVRTSHPDLLDTQEKAKFVPDTDVKTLLRNHIQIDTDPIQRDGRIGSVITDANVDKISGSSTGVRKVIEEMSKRLMKDPHLETFIAGQRYTRQEIVSMVAAKALDTLEGLDGMNPEELRKALLVDADVNTVVGKKFETMNSVNAAATQILLRSLGGEMADLATVERSVRGQVDTATQDAMFLARFETLLRLNKEASYVAGKKLQERTGNWARMFYPEASTADDVSKLIDDQVKGVVGTLREITTTGEDRRLINIFMDAASISNGDVRTMSDLAAFARKKIGMNGWINASSGEQGYLLRSMLSSFFNSVLSGPRTVLRAWTGNAVLTALRPLDLLVGGAMKGDARLMSKSLHQMQAGFEAFGEALTMADKARKAWLSGDPNPMIMRGTDENYLPFHKTEEFKNYQAWAELKGSLGDKFAINSAYHISAFNSSPFVNYGMGLMEMGDTVTRTILGRMELKSRAFDEAWIESGGKVTNDLVQSYEKKLRDSIFDKDGVITDKAANLAAQEITLTTPLSGQAEKFDDFIKAVPLARPFFMFPRTATNALRYVASYTPILNKSLKEIDEVMNCTMESAPAIMQKYGITDLEGARAMYEGRVGLGMITVGSAIGLYLNGKITGNLAVGDEGKRLRTTLNGAPPPRSILFGDKWVSYDAFEPMASILSMVADIGEKADPEDQETMYAKVGFFVAANLTNKSFLAGIGQLTDLVNGNAESFGPTYLANQANNLIPFGGARNWMAQVFSPGKRELDNDFGQRFMNRNPGLKDALPLQRDWITGEPLRINDPMTRLINASLPVNINHTWDKTQQIIYKSGFDVSLAFRKGPDGENLNPKEREKMILYATEGGRIKKALDAEVKKDSFKKSFDAYQEYLNKGGSKEMAPPEAMVHINAIEKVVADAKRYAMTKSRLEEERSGGPMSRAQISNMVKKAGKNGDVGQQQYYLNKLIETPQ